MTDERPLIIDHVDDLELSAADVSRYFNELRSLDYLAQGLGLLFREVRQMEGLATEALGGDKLQVVAIGNVPELKGLPQGLTASFSTGMPYRRATTCAWWDGLQTKKI